MRLHAGNKAAKIAGIVVGAVLFLVAFAGAALYIVHDPAVAGNFLPLAFFNTAKETALVHWGSLVTWWRKGYASISTGEHMSERMPDDAEGTSRPTDPGMSELELKNVNGQHFVEVHADDRLGRELGVRTRGRFDAPIIVSQQMALMYDDGSNDLDEFEPPSPQRPGPELKDWEDV